MVGYTKEEKECPKCRQRGMCDGPEYLGGLCSCECHENAEKIYEYNKGRPRVRIDKNGEK